MAIRQDAMQKPINFVADEVDRAVTEGHVHATGMGAAELLAFRIAVASAGSVLNGRHRRFDLRGSKEP